MSSRRKRAAIAAAIAGGCVLAATAFLVRNDAIEMWQLWRLESPEPARRSRALKAIRPFATMRSAPALVGILRGDAGLRKEAAEVLLDVLDRLRPAQKEELGAMVLDVARSGIVEADPILRVQAPGCPGMYPLLAETLEDPGSRLVPLATQVLLLSWPGSRKAIFDFAERAQGPAILRFLEHAFGVIADPGGPEPDPLGLCIELMNEHPRPEARAMGLSYGVSMSRRDHKRGDRALLGRAYAADPSPLVRGAALRMAGYLGDVEGNLDPGPIIARESDPVLRTVAIQARDLWSRDFHAREPFETALELWDGLRWKWLVRGTPRPKPWTADEIALLEEILATEKDPALRDAASMALASHRAELETGAAVRGFEVHEWGVWRDAREVLSPAEEVADLPEFVHRSRTTAGELRAATISNMVSFKPVIFFRSRKPLAALVRVEFLGGRPWAFHPEATDYVHSFLPLSLDLAPLRPAWIPEPAPLAGISLVERPAFAAPGEELRSRFLVAPWFRLASTGHRDETSAASLGIEWRGLRLGYGPELEGELPGVDDESFWNALRAVPSTPVAVRGARERFLFYDGPIAVPSPVHVVWEDESRRALLLAARPVDAYPEARETPRESRWRGSRPPVQRTAPLPPRGSVPAILVVHKPPGEPARGGILEELDADRAPSRVVLDELRMTPEEIREALLSVLVAEGLTREEAVSLAITWKRRFFEEDGVRTLTVVPRWLYDLALPLGVIPAPEEIARTGVVWKEMSDADAIAAPLTDEESALLRRPLPRIAAGVAIEVREEALPSLPWKPFAWETGGLLDDGSSRARALDLSDDGTRALIHAEPRSGKLDGGQSGCCHYVLDVARERSLGLAVLAAAVTGSVILPDLSGDGDKVAFVSGDGRKWLLRIADLSRETLTTVSLDAGGSASTVMAGSDGRRVVLAMAHALVVVDLEVRRAWRIELGAPVGSLEISGDGRRAACVLVGEGEADDDVYAIDLDARAALDVSHSGGDDWSPSISRDGRRIAFLRNVRGAVELCIADLEARSRTCFPEPDLAHYDSCSISPQGSRLAFTRAGRVYVRDLDSGTVRVVPGSLGARDPVLSADGSRVLYAREESTGRRAYLVPSP